MPVPPTMRRTDLRDCDTIASDDRRLEERQCSVIAKEFGRVPVLWSYSSTYLFNQTQSKIACLCKEVSSPPTPLPKS